MTQAREGGSKASLYVLTYGLCARTCVYVCVCVCVCLCVSVCVYHVTTDSLTAGCYHKLYIVCVCMCVCQTHLSPDAITNSTSGIAVPNNCSSSYITCMYVKLHTRHTHAHTHTITTHTHTHTLCQSATSGMPCLD